MLPKYRRVVEDLFEKKLLAVAVCTETLAAGINLPARSVVLSSCFSLASTRDWSMSRLRITPRTRDTSGDILSRYASSRHGSGPLL